eukprot:gb/GEZN01004833.1/.p1 GENE.gb/GEZN01004833.1/~~gb/GEZN01004833.1/.p1  ORF type:complete len:524 (-),score=71.08 gb/GEZN01004833.1/:290-1861(-)
MSASMSMEEVAKHNTSESAWVVIDGDVYDVTKFYKLHPGGAAILFAYAGKEATEAFFDMHRASVLVKYQKMKIGRLAGAPKGRALDLHEPGVLSMVPHAEHSSLQGWVSPFFTEEHKRLRSAVKKWYDINLVPFADQIGKSEKLVPKEIYLKMGQAGLLAGHLAPSALLTQVCNKHNIPCPGAPEQTWDKWNYWKEQIVHEEHFRLGQPGVSDGLTAGYSIATPCLVSYGTPFMQQEILPLLLKGEKKICLAISEPFAGSDVANIKTTAVKTPCGKFYEVNGVKKWITGGQDSDYFVTAVRTGGKGIPGISMLLIERSEGLKTSIIKTSYSASAGTAYITMEKVMVPVENLLGKENQGFNLIMNNFNHERWMIVVNVLAQCRVILSDCILWANQRKVFGKPLITEPIIQAKISEMAAQMEALSAWSDLVTHQMTVLPHKEQGRVLAGPIGLLKFYSTRVSTLVADHASQIFGGRAITRNGMGQNVERFARSQKYAAIYGGSEEIMVSLAAKQMLKRLPPMSRL